MNSMCSRFKTLTLRLPRYQTHQNATVRGLRPRRAGQDVTQKAMPNSGDGTPYTKLSKYALYTAVVVPGTFAGCAIWHYESVRKITIARMTGLPVPNARRKEGSLRDHFNAMWNSLSPGRKVALGLIQANLTIFLLWRIPAAKPFLYRYFMCAPTKAHSVVASTLSAFSHQQFLHLFVNMYVLWSFSDIMTRFMAKEQFMAVFLGSATFAGFVSSVSKVVRRAAVPSVGASGALMCILAIFCTNFPNQRLQVAIIGEFIPHSFQASTGLMCIVCLDIAGVIFRWRLLDHAGHLGGVLFGVTYSYLVKTGWIAYFRKSILDRWHRIRK